MSKKHRELYGWAMNQVAKFWNNNWEGKWALYYSYHCLCFCCSM